MKVEEGVDGEGGVVGGSEEEDGVFGGCGLGGGLWR